MKEATARIKINRLLETAGWRFFADKNGPVNVQLEPSVTLNKRDLDGLGDDFEKAPKGFIDFLLLNEKGFPFIVLEAKSEDKSPLVGKEQARKYAKSQNCRFVILSNGNLHYFWDLERGNPYVITAFPTPTSVTGYQKTTPNPKRLIEEVVGDGVAGQTRVPMVPLGEVAELIRGITFGKSEQLDRATDNSLLVATTKAAQSSGIVEADLYHVPRTVLKDDTKLLRSGDILISTANSLNLLGRTTHVRKVERPMSFGAFMSLIRPNERILDGYLIHCLRTAYAADFFVRNANTTTNISNLNLSALAVFQIPLPPLEVQKEIVAEIEGYQKVINGARAVLDHYRPHIPIHPDWPMVELGEVCDVRDGTHDSPKYVLEGYPLITSKNLKDGFIDFTDVNLISREDLDAINKRSKVDAGDLLMPMIGTIGNPVVADASREYAVKNVALIKFPKGCQVDNRFLNDLLDSAAMQDRFQRQASGSTQKFIPLGFIRKLEIPLPPLAKQQAIVAEIEAERALVTANRELITRFERKIQATLARIWGEPAPATYPEPASAETRLVESTSTGASTR